MKNMSRDLSNDKEENEEKIELSVACVNFL